VINKKGARIPLHFVISDRVVCLKEVDPYKESDI
jgi:hypothetical protein